MSANDGSEDDRFEKAASENAGQRDLLAARLCDLPADEPAVCEVSISGDRAFIVNEKMAVHASKGRDPLVCIDTGDAKFSEIPEVSPAEIDLG